MVSHVPECGAVTLKATLVDIGLREAVDSLGENNTKSRVDHPSRCIVKLRDRTDITVETYHRQLWTQSDI